MILVVGCVVVVAVRSIFFLSFEVGFLPRILHIPRYNIASPFEVVIRGQFYSRASRVVRFIVFLAWQRLLCGYCCLEFDIIFDSTFRTGRGGTSVSQYYEHSQLVRIREREKESLLLYIYTTFSFFLYVSRPVEIFERIISNGSNNFPFIIVFIDPICVKFP